MKNPVTLLIQTFQQKHDSKLPSLQQITDKYRAYTHLIPDYVISHQSLHNQFFSLNNYSKSYGLNLPISVIFTQFSAEQILAFVRNHFSFNFSFPNFENIAKNFLAENSIDNRFLPIFITNCLLFGHQYQGDFDKIFVDFSATEPENYDFQPLNQPQADLELSHINNTDNTKFLLKQLKTQQVQNSDLQDEIDSLREKITIQSNQLQLIHAENTQQITLIQHVHEMKIAEMENQIQRIQDENANLKQKQNEFEQCGVKFDDFRSVVAQNRAFSTQIALYEENLKKIQLEYGQKVQELQEKTLIGKSNEFELKTIQKSIEQIKEQAQFHIQMMQSKVQQSNQLYLEQQEQLFSFKQQNEKLVSESREMSQQCQQKINVMEQKNYQLQNEIFTLEKQLVVFQQSESQIDVKQNIQKIKADVIKISQQSKEKQQLLKQQLQTVNNELFQAQQTISENNYKYQQLKQQNVELAKISTQVRKENQHITDKLKSMVGSKSIKAEIGQLVLENQSLRNQIRTYQDNFNENIGKLYENPVQNNVKQQQQKVDNYIIPQQQLQNNQQKLVENFLVVQPPKEVKREALEQSVDNAKIDIKDVEISSQSVIQHEQQSQISIPTPFEFIYKSQLPDAQSQLPAVSKISLSEEYDLGEVNIQIDVPQKQQVYGGLLPGIQQQGSVQTVNTNQAQQFKVPNYINSDADLLEYNVQITDLANLQ